MAVYIGYCLVEDRHEPIYCDMSEPFKTREEAVNWVLDNIQENVRNELKEIESKPRISDFVPYYYIADAPDYKFDADDPISAEGLPKVAAEHLKRVDGIQTGSEYSYTTFYYFDVEKVENYKPDPLASIDKLLPFNN